MKRFKIPLANEKAVIAPDPVTSLLGIVIKTGPKIGKIADAKPLVDGIKKESGKNKINKMTIKAIAFNPEIALLNPLTIKFCINVFSKISPTPAAVAIIKQTLKISAAPARKCVQNSLSVFQLIAPTITEEIKKKVATSCKPPTPNPGTKAVIQGICSFIQIPASLNLVVPKIESQPIK